MKIKLVWTPWGSNIALGVYAPTRKKAERIYNYCFNYGVISKEIMFHLLKDDKKRGCFGYFKTTWPDLVKIARIPYMAELLPRTQKEIDAMREDFLNPAILPDALEANPRLAYIRF